MRVFAILLILTIGLACLLPHKVVGFKPKDKPSKSLINNAKLFMTLKSDDGVVIRTARGSENLPSSPLPEMKLAIDESEPKNGNGAGAGGSLKRNKHGGHRKTNRNQSLNHSSTGNGRKSHMEKKPINSGEQTSQHVGKRQQFSNRQHGNQQQNNNKDQQFLRGQQNQEQHSHLQENKRKSIHKTEEQEIANSKTQSTCRYTKSPWSDCDKSTNTHSRTLTLKKGDSNCLPTRTIQKKCKKTCRYEKGAWSECKNSEMTRIDKLKTSESTSGTNSSCEATRTVNRKCNQERKNNNGKSNKKERKNKDKDSKQQPA